jgi:Ca-activated chloride channel family protein
VLTACALGAAPHAGVAQTSDLAKPRSSVEIVLESSEGMGVEGVGGARKAIVGAVRTLPEGTPVGLRVFGAKVPAKEGSAACSDSQLVVPVGPVDAQATSAALKHLKPTAARSPVSLALTRAAKDLPPTGNRTIVLVGSDADDCAPAPPTCQVTPGARQPIRVDAIGLEIDPAGRRDLQCTAQRTGGVYSDARNNRALEPELEAALGRATRDRRSLGTPLVGALAEQQGTTAKAGQYIDSIAPDTERWYHVAAPLGQRLTAVATLLAPPGTDVSAPGSSLNLEGFGAGPRAGKLAGKDATATASNLFAFDPSQAITVSVAAVPSRAGNDLRVALHDSPDKQLAQSLRGRSFVLELLFDLAPEAAPARPHTAVAPAKSSHDVSWPAAGAAAVVCALIAFAALAFVPRRVRSGDEA